MGARTRRAQNGEHFGGLDSTSDALDDLLRAGLALHREGEVREDEVRRLVMKMEQDSG